MDKLGYFKMDQYLGVYLISLNIYKKIQIKGNSELLLAFQKYIWNKLLIYQKIQQSKEKNKNLKD